MYSTLNRSKNESRIDISSSQSLRIDFWPKKFLKIASREEFMYIGNTNYIHMESPTLSLLSTYIRKLICFLFVVIHKEMKYIDFIRPDKGKA